MIISHYIIMHASEAYCSILACNSPRKPTAMLENVRHLCLGVNFILGCTPSTWGRSRILSVMYLYHKRNALLSDSV